MKSEAVKIVKRLRAKGHEAYLVGGCVRDMLMGKIPKDWDVATSATPDEIMDTFPKTIPVGARFGVVIVRSRGENYEVATFREEWGYADGRRPDGVRFSTAKADARRRDFTINGLFYDPVADEVIDYVGGRKDLRRGVVRAIGDPRDRFEEDKLRMLRAVRFAAGFYFRIDKRTGRAIREHASEINRVSAERIREELVKVLTGNDPVRGTELMDESGLLDAVLPEVAAMKGVPQPPQFHPEGDVFNHTMIMLDIMKPRYARRADFVMAVLLHDVGKPPTYEEADRIRFNNHPSVGADMAESIMKRLRFSSDAVKSVSRLIRSHLRFIDAPRMRPATLKRFLRMDDFDLHLELHRLDCLASHGDLSTYHLCKGKLREMARHKEPLRPPRLITGDDLIAMGLAPGPAFGRILRDLEDAQLEGAVKTRRQALAFAGKRIKAKKDGGDKAGAEKKRRT